MSILSSIVSGLSNAEKFLLSFLTKASAWQKVFASLTPGVLSAVAAVFYDVVKTVGAAEAAALAASSGSVPTAITLSETTLTLVKQVVADFKAGEAAVVAAFEALNITLPAAK